MIQIMLIGMCLNRFMVESTWSRSCWLGCVWLDSWLNQHDPDYVGKHHVWINMTGSCWYVSCSNQLDPDSAHYVWIYLIRTMLICSMCFGSCSDVKIVECLKAKRYGITHIFMYSIYIFSSFVYNLYVTNADYIIKYLLLTPESGN